MTRNVSASTQVAAWSTRYPDGEWPRFYPGWVVVGATFLLMMVNAGLGFYGLAVYLEALTGESGYSVSAVSAATSVYFVLSAFTGRAVAPLIERYDIRLVIGTGSVIAAAGLWMLSRSTSLGTLFLAYGVFAIGFGAAGLVPATTLITRWFSRRRSIALSIASTGLSVGGLSLTVLAARWIRADGMAGAGPKLALTYLLVSGVTLFGLWPDPESRGVQVEGTGQASTTTRSVEVDYDAAVRGRFFRLTTFGFVVSMGAQVGGIAQLAKLGSDRVNAAAGPLMVSALALTSVVARLVGGVLAARFSNIWLTSMLAAAQGVALVGLSIAETERSLILATVLFGATVGNLLMLQPLLMAERFGVESYPRVFSLQQLIVTGLGVAGGPYLLGSLRDNFDYRLSYVVAGLLSALGATVFFIAARLAVR